MDAGAINFQDTDGDKRFEGEEEKGKSKGFDGPASSIKESTEEAAE